MFKSILLLACFFVLGFSQSVVAQKIEVINTDFKSSIRGLSVVSDQIIWASGSQGKVGKSLDGGKTWKWMVVPGFEKNEFRDIEAFDANTAVAMAITEPAQIVRTSDGGQNWKIVFADTAKGLFYDAMDFADENNGVLIGDPIPGSNYIYRAYTRNGGAAWFRPKDDSLSISPVQKGEAMFASSGSNVAFLKSDGFLRNNKMWIVTGGTASNLLSQNPTSKTALPILRGKESTGANSIAYFNSKEFVVVGGDFANDKDSTLNCILSRDGGLSFIKPYRPPHGYKSCVEYLSRTKLISCGTSGVDVSTDSGMTWDTISKDGFHVCSKAKKGSAVFLAGNGKIAKLIW